jgi:hypothetical protein
MQMRLLWKTLIAILGGAFFIFAPAQDAINAAEDQFAYVTVTEAPASQHSIYPTRVC